MITIYTDKIQAAIKFATKTHEVYQKQKRKGKDIPYITHPLTVGLILARAEADENTIIAGILHDTMEDSIPEKKVTREMLAERFGDEVATLVDSVTEKDKGLLWEQRKSEALEHIKHFSHGSLLVKSADIISNVAEILEDYKKDGDQTFTRFNAPKDKILLHSRNSIATIVECWGENPLKRDLLELDAEMYRIQALDQGHVAYLEWNLFYILYEIDRALANSFGAEKVIDLCKQTQAGIDTFREQNDVHSFERDFLLKMKEFDVVINNIKETSGEDMLYFLLISHIADSIYTLRSFVDIVAQGQVGSTIEPT
ncbi:MAG: HD domain-containing protein [Parcubacteria group bacterium]|nr:HD domain-containing protein [Parcubacteria group bacterium]